MGLFDVPENKYIILEHLLNFSYSKITYCSKLSEGVKTEGSSLKIK